MKYEKLTDQDIIVFVVLLIIFILLGGYLVWFRPSNELSQFFSAASQKTRTYSTITSSDFNAVLFKTEQYQALKSNAQSSLPERRQIPNNPFAPANNQVTLSNNNLITEKIINEAGAGEILIKEAEEIELSNSR